MSNGSAGSGCKQSAFGGKRLADGERLALDAAQVVLAVCLSEPGIELCQCRHVGHRHEMRAAEAADVTLDTALLMCPSWPRQAEEGVEAVMGSQGDEALVLLAGAPGQHADHRRLEIVVADARRHAAEVRECGDMAVEEGFLRLGRVGAMEGTARGGEAQMKEEEARADAGHVHITVPEVAFRFCTRQVDLGDRHHTQSAAQLGTHLANVGTHGRLGHGGAVLLPQPLPDAPPRVALLARRALVCRQPVADDRLPWPQHGRLPRGRLARWGHG